MRTLSALDPEQHAFAVDIPNLEAAHFPCTQAGALGNGQDRLVLDAGRRIQHPTHFVPAEHARQPAGMLGNLQHFFVRGGNAPTELVGTSITDYVKQRFG